MGEHQKMDSIFCYICNMYVPKQFLQEHKMSLKHKSYMEIANTALERIKEHIYDENNNDDIQVNESIYFCAHCVSVVNVKDKNYHENSINHKKSVKSDKYLSDFLVLYTNGIEKTFDIDKENEEFKIIQTDHVSLEHKKSEDMTTDDFDLKNYLNILKNKYKMPMNVNVIDKELLEILIGGCRVHVAADNFLAFKEFNATNKECVVCTEIVKDKDKVAHVMKEKHMNRISIPIQDVHCRREIYPSWHHCILCNVIIYNYKYHTISDPVHKRRLEEALKSDDTETGNSTNETSNNWNIVYKKNNKSDITTNKSLEELDSNYKYLIKIECDKLSCIVCDVTLHPTDSFIETHINLDEHIKKYNDLLATNKIQKQYNNDFFCGICNRIVINKHEILHVNNIYHKQYLDDTKDEMNNVSNVYFYCNICNVKVPNNASNKQTHEQGKPHLKNIIKYEREKSRKN